MVCLEIVWFDGKLRVKSEKFQSVARLDEFNEKQFETFSVEEIEKNKVINQARE